MEHVIEKSTTVVNNIYQTLMQPLPSKLMATLTSWIPQHIMQSFKLKSILTAPLVVTSVIVNGSLKADTFDVFKYVDPLIGTMDGGKHIETWQ